MKFILLALLIPSLGFTAPIDWSSQDVYFSQDLIHDCVSSTNESHREDCKKLIKIARAELPAWESCTSFKMPEANANNETPKTQAEIKGILARISTCVPIVGEKAFGANALDICSSLSKSVEVHQKCLKDIADRIFQNDAFNTCTEFADKDFDQTLLCLNNIKDKTFEMLDIATCNDASTAALRATCFKSKGKPANDVKECNQRLAEIQSKISDLAGSSSETTMKNQLQGIVDAIQEQSAIPAK